MRRSRIATHDERAGDGLDELERLILSEIDRLAVAEQPRPTSPRRPTHDAAPNGDARTPAGVALDPNPEVAVGQIVAWLADRPDRDAVVADLLTRLGAGQAMHSPDDADTAPSPSPSS